MTCACCNNRRWWMVWVAALTITKATNGFLYASLSSSPLSMSLKSTEIKRSCIGSSMFSTRLHSCMSSSSKSGSCGSSFRGMSNSRSRSYHHQQQQHQQQGRRSTSTVRLRMAAEGFDPASAANTLLYSNLPKEIIPKLGSVTVRFINHTDKKGDVVVTAPQGTNVVKLAKQYGVVIATSCCSGICGTCTTDLYTPGSSDGYRPGWEPIRACVAGVEAPSGCPEMVLDCYRGPNWTKAMPYGRPPGENLADAMKRFADGWENEYKTDSRPTLTVEQLTHNIKDFLYEKPDPNAPPIGLAKQISEGYIPPALQGESRQTLDDILYDIKTVKRYSDEDQCAMIEDDGITYEDLYTLGGASKIWPPSGGQLMRYDDYEQQNSPEPLTKEWLRIPPFRGEDQGYEFASCLTTKRAYEEKLRETQRQKRIEHNLEMMYIHQAYFGYDFFDPDNWPRNAAEWERGFVALEMKLELMRTEGLIDEQRVLDRDNLYYLPEHIDIDDTPYSPRRSNGLTPREYKDPNMTQEEKKRRLMDPTPEEVEEQILKIDHRKDPMIRKCMELMNDDGYGNPFNPDDFDDDVDDDDDDDDDEDED